MGHLETNLSTVYIQNSRIHARSGGKPFHLGWQLELCWKKLWNVSSLAPRNLHSIPAAAHREGWVRSSSVLASSSCSCSSGCRPAARQAGKRLPFKGTESQGLGHLGGTDREPFPAQLSDQDCRLWQWVPSEGCRHLFCLYGDCRIHKIRKDPKDMPGNFVLGCSRVTAPSPWRGIFSI